MEYQICDRLSFMRFLNLTIADDVPDSKTVWAFRESLTDLGLIETLFDVFKQELARLNLIVKEGKIVDASFIEVPKQRNNREENAQIKAGKVPEAWQSRPNKLAQKDTDAKWTKKNNETYYGYKNHIKIDQKSKLILQYVVTDAAVHDSQVLSSLLDKKEDSNQALYADSAYTGENQEKAIAVAEMSNKVCEKGYRNHPLTQEQKANNTEKSRTRCRVEHVFGFMENSMQTMSSEVIGIKRNVALIGLMNLTYNLFRKIQLTAC